MEKLKKIKRILDPVKRKAYFLGLLTQEMENKGFQPPIVVGGLSLELYTQGSYTTGDIDIKSPKEPLEEILLSWGFTKKGRVWVNEEYDLYVDWLGSSLDEGIEAEKRLNIIQIGKKLKIYVLSIEDLIIDRLNAVKWWDDKDGILWVRVLLEVKKALKEKIDYEYLKKRAKKEGILDLLEKILEESL